MSTLTFPAALPRRPRPARPAPAAQLGIPPCDLTAGGPVTPVRLTRRGRLVMIVAALAAAFGILGVAQPPALALGPGDTAVSRRITVRPGETLWAIAQRTTPGADPRDTVARIQSVNDLDTSSVPAGSVLLVPSTG